MLRKRKYLLLLFLLVVTAQMPDWKFFRDGDGNTYYFDKNGKIFTSGEIEKDFITVSVKGLDYAVHQAEELILRHHPAAGLRLLKTVLSMPPDDMRIVDAQRRASADFNKLKRREGSRFADLNRKASPCIFRSGGQTHIVNDVLFYSLASDYSADVLKNTWRLKYRYWYNGIRFGMHKTSSAVLKSRVKYDFLIAFDTEKFAGEVSSAADLQDSWTVRLMYENLTRKVISKDEKRIINSFESGGADGFRGFEAVIVNGRFGYMVRAIIPAKNFLRYRSDMLKTVRNFKVSDIR